MSTGKIGRGDTRPVADAELRVDMDALFGEAAAPDPRTTSVTPARRSTQARPVEPRPRQKPVRIYGAVVTALVFLFAVLALWTKGDGTPPARRPAPSAQSPEASSSSKVETPVVVESALRDSFVALPLGNPSMPTPMTPDRAAAAPPPAARPAAIPVAVVSPRAQAAPAPQPAPATDVSPVAKPTSVPLPAPTSAESPTPVPLPAPTSAPATTLAAAIPAATVARADSTLRVIERPAPSYPPQALREQLSGRVVARLTISTDGSVTDVQIESATPPRIFDRAATAALRQWRYAPIAAPQQTTVELDFKLEQ
jgi:protein TonB